MPWVRPKREHESTAGLSVTTVSNLFVKAPVPERARLRVILDLDLLMAHKSRRPCPTSSMTMATTGYSQPSLAVLTHWMNFPMEG